MCIFLLLLSAICPSVILLVALIVCALLDPHGKPLGLLVDGIRQCRLLPPAVIAVEMGPVLATGAETRIAQGCLSCRLVDQVVDNLYCYLRAIVEEHFDVIVSNLLESPPE
jgi:hypothetical protein